MHTRFHGILRQVLAAIIIFGLIPVAQFAVPGTAHGAESPIHFTRQPVERSVYARSGTLRLSVQAQSTDGNAVTYQWKYSPNADLSGGQDADSSGDADTKSVLTATVPDTPGTYYYWVEVSAGSSTVPSEAAQVIVLDEIISDTYTVNQTKANGSTYTQADYDKYYMKNLKLMGASGTTTGSYYEWAGNQLYTSLQNGDFENRAASGTMQYLRTGVPYWDTTHGIGTYSSFKFPKVIESQSASSAYQLSTGGVAAELSASVMSSLYEEVATVPGKVYEWSMNQAIHGGVLNILAVIIGPADESDASDPKPWPYGVDGNADTLDTVTSAVAKYTGASVNDPTVFERVVAALAAQLNVADTSTLATNGTVEDSPNGMYEEFTTWVSRGEEYTDQAYAVPLDGKTYYVYLALADQDESGNPHWVAHSGSYSVPAGQGRTVFAFASVYSANAGTGNVLDDIVFASGSAPDGNQEVSYTGESAVKNVTTKDGYAYALAEVRGSTVYPLQERDVWFTPQGGVEQEIAVNAEVGDGISWYTPGNGSLAFKNLVPGKTYRLIGIPVAAISTGLGTNVSPSDVLDDGYYTDTTVKAGKDDTADGTGANLSAALYNTGTGAEPVYKGRIIMAATDSRSEYALLTKDAGNHWVPLAADGSMLTVDAEPLDANWQAGTGASLVFNGLEPGREYRLIARPAGYVELNWKVVGENESSGVVKITIPEPGSDVTASMVSRASTASSDTLTLTGVDAGVKYHILEVASGKQLAEKTGATSYTIDLVAAGSSAAQAIQVVAEIGGTFTQGVRVYPYPEFVASKVLTIDYEKESIGVGAGPVPAGVQYRVDYASTNLITGTTTDDGYRTASGGARIQLGVSASYVARPILDSIESGSGTLSYRLAVDADYDGDYLAPVSELSIPARPAGDPEPSNVDWAAEQIGDKTFAEYGYNGLADLTVQLTDPPVAGAKFRSKPVDYLIHKRPAAPSGLGAEYADSDLTVSGLDPSLSYQYSTDKVNWTSIGTITDGKAELGSATTYYVRFAPSPSTHEPASLPVRASDYPVAVENVAFDQLTYGYTVPASLPMNITNKAGASSEGNDRNTSLTIDDQLKDGQAFAAGAFQIDGSAAQQIPVLDAHETKASGYLVKVKPGLAAGAYTATLTLHYTGGSGPATAQAELSVYVGKADWVVGDLEHTLDVPGNQVEVTLTGGLPSGAVAEYSLDQVTWQDSGTFTGLEWATEYEVYARAKGDENHNLSAPALLEAKVFTDQPTPVWANVLRVNYAAETLEFKAGVAPSEYQVTAAGNPISANGSLTAFADAGGDIDLVRSGADDPRVGPGPSAVATQTITGRPAAPAQVDISTVMAETATRPTGKIIHASGTEFEYRPSGSNAAWTSVKSGTATNVAYGSYDLRFPATANSFASPVLTVLVDAEYLEFQVTWTGTESGEAGATSISVEEYDGDTLVGPVSQGGKVARGHQARFTATTTVLDAWYDFTWNDGSGNTVHRVTWNGSDFQVTDTFELPVTGTLPVSLGLSAYYKRAVAYDANEGQGSVAATANSAADPDYTVTVADGAGLSREDYAFTGWNTEPDGSGDEYLPGSTFSMTSGYFESGADVTLYAQWKSTLADESELSELLETVDGLITSGVFATYTDESVKVLQDAIQAAKALMEGKPSQDAVDAAHQRVLDAVSGLQVKPTASDVLDPTTLTATLALAAQFPQRNYSPESYAKLTAAIKAAEKVLAAGNVTQAQFDAAANAVLQAMKGLKLHYVTSVRVNVTSLRIVKGRAFPLAALSYLTNGDSAGVTFSSSNPKLVSVAADGVITGLKTGSATITVASTRPGSNGKPVTAKVKVTVVAKQVAVTAVSANVPKTLKVGQSKGLVAKWTKATATPSLVGYTSSNTDIATVDKTGLLKALKAGIVKITVRVGTKAKAYTLGVGRIVPATPKIVGSAKVGKTLKVAVGKWAPSGVKFKYQWYRSGKRIPGATKAGYKVGKADKGKTLTVKVTGSKSGFPSVAKTSKRTAKVR